MLKRNKDANVFIGRREGNNVRVVVKQKRKLKLRKKLNEMGAKSVVGNVYGTSVSNCEDTRQTLV
jgi:hypothetical protein